MGTCAPELTALTTDDVWAIRNSDQVSFHTQPGRSWMVVSLRDFSGDRVFSVREQTVFNTKSGTGERAREIEVPETRLEDYSGRTGEYTAFTMWVPAEVWLTIGRGVRAGDVLGFLWISDHSEMLRDNGMRMDSLRLFARDADRKNGRAWNVRTEVSKVGNLSGMILRK